METEQVMRKHGRTFFWASAFLPKKEAEDIYTLYAFCRFIDDHVDIKGLSCQKIMEDLEIKQSNLAVVQQFLSMAIRRRMDLAPAKTLVHTIEQDREGQRIDTWRTLIRYCYGVASTVGLMICDILGVSHPQAYAFAIDLGIAMQLTNIARDVYEDASQNRIYLPMEAFSIPLSCDHILSNSHCTEVLSVREKVLKLADRYYSSADQGMHFLPIRSRLAIITASRLYQAKGLTIRKNPIKYLHVRANVKFFKKIHYTLKALQFFCTGFVQSRSEVRHDASLHSDLQYLHAADI